MNSSNRPERKPIFVWVANSVKLILREALLCGLYYPQFTVLPATHFQVTIQTDDKIASEVPSVAEFSLEMK
jgi:hypothetical protein